MIFTGGGLIAAALYYKGGNNMREVFQKIAKLIDVKSIISLLFAVCLSIGFLNDRVDVKDYLTVCTMAFTFYFSFQRDKKSDADENRKE